MKLIKRFFIGPEFKQTKKREISIHIIIKQIEDTWKEDNSIGIELFFKLFFNFIQLINPYIWLRSLFDYCGYSYGIIFADIYVLIKLAFPIFILCTYSFFNDLSIGFCIFIILDSVLYEIRKFILCESISEPVSNMRSILFLFINYLVVTLSFSVLYRGWKLINKVFNSLDAVYFSFVTSSTLGYGECLPIDWRGQLLVIYQIIIMFLFISILLSKLLSNLNSNEK